MKKRWLVVGFAGALLVGGAVWRLSARDDYAVEIAHLQRMRPAYQQLLGRLQSIASALPGPPVTERLDVPLVFDAKAPRNNNCDVLSIYDLNQLQPGYAAPDYAWGALERFRLYSPLENCCRLVSSSSGYGGGYGRLAELKALLDGPLSLTYIVLYRVKGKPAYVSLDGKSFSRGEVYVDVFLVDMRRDAVVRSLTVSVALPSSVEIEFIPDDLGGMPWSERQLKVKSQLVEAQGRAVKAAMLRSLADLGR